MFLATEIIFCIWVFPVALENGTLANKVFLPNLFCQGLAIGMACPKLKDQTRLIGLAML